MIYVKKITSTDPEATTAGEWLQQDELHQSLGLKLEDLFEDGTESAMIYDEEGPLIAIRFHRALRVGMQFRPASRIRIAKIGAEVVNWMKEIAAKKKCKELIIRPGGKAANFAERLGFREFIGKYLGV